MEIPFMKHKKKENIFVPSQGFYIYMPELLSLTQTLFSLLKSSQPQDQKGAYSFCTVQNLATQLQFTKYF